VNVLYFQIMAIRERGSNNVDLGKDYATPNLFQADHHAAGLVGAVNAN